MVVRRVVVDRAVAGVRMVVGGVVVVRVGVVVVIWVWLW